MNYFFMRLTISGKALAFFREKAGLTQSELADIIESSRVTVTNWESKESITFKDDQAKELLKALKTTEKDITMYQQKNDQGIDILDHPVIKSLVVQSEYIMKRVNELEEENKRLRSNQKN